MPFTAAAGATGFFAMSSAGAAFAANAAVVGAVAGVAGAGMTAYGSYQQGQQAEEMADYNAAVLNTQAKEEEMAAAYEADMQAAKGRKLMARQRTQYAKAGVTSAGSPMLVFEETGRNLAQDIRMTRWGSGRKASYLRSQASMSLMKGKSAMSAGMWGAGTALLSGVSSATGSIGKYMGSQSSGSSSSGGK